MRAAFVQNGLVLNVLEVETLDVFPGLIEAGPDAEPGGTYENGVFTRRGKTAAEIAATISTASLDALPDVIAYIAAKSDAPQKVKDASAVIDAEKLKVK